MISPRIYDSYLGTLMAEIDMLPEQEFRAPLGPIKPGEKKLGIVTSDAITVLYTLMMKTKRTVAEETVKAHFAESLAATAEHAKSVAELSMKEHILNLLLWATVRAEIGCWDKNIAYREGWMLVECPPTNLADMFHQIMGGDE